MCAYNLLETTAHAVSEDPYTVIRLISLIRFGYTKTAFGHRKRSFPERN